MPDEPIPEGVPVSEVPADRAPRRSPWANWRRKYGLGLPVALCALLCVMLLGLDTAIGHRLLVDWLESGETDTGLGISIGRIDGSIYGTAQLEDVSLRDPQGVFLRVPVVVLQWTPIAWLDNRLHIRQLVLRRGVLLRVPQLRPSPITGSILPDFDVRVDRFAIERLTVASAVLGVERRVDLHARTDIRRRSAFLSVQGKLGGGDRLTALLNDDRTHNRFDLGLDYQAPKGGLLAALTGARTDRRVRIGGRGDWQKWRGGLLADAGGKRAAAVRITRREGRFTVDGLVWTAPLTDPATSRQLGEKLALSGNAILADNQLTGTLQASSSTLRVSGKGGVDLGAGAFRNLAITGETRGRLAVGKDSVEGAKGSVLLDGPFAALTADASLAAARWITPTTSFEGLTAKGTGQRGARGWTLPFTLTASRIITGNATLDPHLVGARARGTLTLTGNRLAASDLAIAAPGLAGRFTLGGDIGGAYALSGHLVTNGLQVPDLGRSEAEATLALRLAPGGAWKLAGKLGGHVDGIVNPALARLAGDQLSFSGEATAGSGQPLSIPRLVLAGEHLTLSASGQRNADGTAEFTGSGHHAVFGAFTLDARLASDGPHVALVLPDPYPTAGVRDMTLEMSPVGQGLHITTQGASMFGPFAGAAMLQLGAPGGDRLDVNQLTISKTAISGSLTLPPGGALGALTLSGGGVSGSIRLAPRGGGQGVDLALTLTDAHFGGDNPIGIARGQLTASGVLLKYHSTLQGSLQAQGIGAGRLFLGQLAANARLEDGVGHVTATLAGRRGSRFELQLAGDIGPGQVAVMGHGIFAGQSIAMPRHAVFSARPEAEGGGWSLAPSQIDFGQGRAIASGVLGNGTHELNLALAGMPLALGDVVFTDLGLGGLVSGTLHFTHPREGLPSGDVHLLVRGLTRSGLAVTSRPIDLAVVGKLAADRLETRAIASDSGRLIGRLEASIAGLPSAGSMIDRLRAGRLLAQMRYQGPSDAPWRLMGMDELDLTGPIAIAANMGGSIDAPVIRGSLAGDSLHLQSADTGTDITQVKARGIFSGSQLTFNTLAGQTVGGGQVTGSGSITFAGITDGRRPGIDLTLAARKAQLASRADLALTATGPMRITSNGRIGTIAGRITVDSARWRLGLAQSADELPNIPVREINRSADVAPASERHTVWRFLVDLAGRNKINVVGLGLDSEWAANLHLRGTLRDPTLDGTADLVGGSYEFAGARFSLTRGRIIFTDSTSSDPRLDIAATANITGLAATVTVHGTSLKPQISFSSIPPLPEEEVLSRLLFDESVDKISAPEAVQLGAALTTLHGGGGLDPITRVRSAIGLDRLRIVGPDPTLGRQTGVAAGKYIGRRFYAEVMSDGHGYSATNLEFRVSRWLSLLGSVSTVGDQSVNVRVSKDY